MTPRPRNPMPEDVRHALVAQVVEEDYAARPAYQRNDYLGWIARARTQDTRDRRIGQMVDELRAGGVYMGMTHPTSRKKPRREA